MFKFVKRLLAVAVVAGGMAGSAGTAAATDAPPPGYRAVTTFKLVTETRVVEVPVQKTVTKYDHCGKPFTVTITAVKEVEVEITRKVPVVKFVKVCDY